MKPLQARCPVACTKEKNDGDQKKKGRSGAEGEKKAGISRCSFRYQREKTHRFRGQAECPFVHLKVNKGAAT